MTTSRPHKLYPINHLLFQGNRVNRDEGNSPIPVLDRAIALFLSQASGRSLLFGVSEFYDQSPLRRMLVTDSAQSFLPMIRRLIQPEVGFYTPSQAGINVAVTNHMNAMSEQEGRLVTLSEAHTNFSSNAGNRRVATQGLPSERRGGRINTTMDEMRALSRAARTIVNGRELCINGCGRLQVTVSNPLCQTCVAKKSKRKREEDEESGARIYVECDEEIVGRMLKGCCNPCYQRRLRKTGRVIDPAKKLCTHVSGCGNKEYMDGLCQRHYRERRLEASAASECAASASAATAPKKKRTTKTRNGKKKKKKTKTKKPVVTNKTGKTEGETSVHYEDEEVEVDSDYDDEDERDEEY